MTVFTEVVQLLVVGGCYLAGLFLVEALIRYRRDYHLWNGGICAKTGRRWLVSRRDDGKFELFSGHESELLTGWIRPFKG